MIPSPSPGFTCLWVLPHNKTPAYDPQSLTTVSFKLLQLERLLTLRVCSLGVFWILAIFHLVFCFSVSCKKNHPLFFGLFSLLSVVYFLQCVCVCVLEEWLQYNEIPSAQVFFLDNYWVCFFVANLWTEAIPNLSAHPHTLMGRGRGVGD